MDQLFDTGEPPRGRTAVPPEQGPLAARMRPRTLDEFVGQEHVLGAGSRAAHGDRAGPAALDGPLRAARQRARRRSRGSSPTRARRRVRGAQRRRGRPRRGARRCSSAPRERRQGTGEPTIFFLDEIHRFNKAQQDALLPAVEEGLVTLIGATTENPYFEVNSALLSRTQVYELRALEAADVEVLLRRALDRGECGGARRRRRGRGVPRRRAPAATPAPRSRRSSSRARPAAEGEPITLERAEDALQRRAAHYDKTGDRHYDTISAWIKATRGSDPDASLYYLAVMLEGGEDPRFIVRRMVVLASEDIGNADPQALQVAVERRARRRARRDARGVVRARPVRDLPGARAEVERRRRRARPRPRARARARRPAAARRTCGAPRTPARRARPRRGYDYPHDNPDQVSEQELLPDRLAGTRFYEPTETEAALRERLEAIRRARRRSGPSGT